jgi:hypothetical protein
MAFAMRMFRPIFAAVLLIGICVSAGPNTSAQTASAYFEFSVSPRPETFVFKTTNPATISQARQILQTGQQKIVIGTIIRQPVFYNPQWSFHFDPQAVGFADFAIEVCDSSIRGVEDNLAFAFPTWCPWATRLLREIPAPPLPGPDNIQPTISLSFPYADLTFSTVAPSTVQLRANADDVDGSIAKVEFFNEDIKLGEVTATPYSVDWINLSPGVYTISAVATDNLGATRNSQTVRFTVLRPSSGNAIDNTPLFVSQHYRDFFSREPDAPGQAFWQNNIDSCGNDVACREVKRIDTSAAFFLSIEFQETGYLVHRLYRSSFGRRPQFSEFLRDNKMIGRDVIVNTPGWQERLENNKRAFFDAWVQRAAFESAYNTLGNREYVEALITNTRVVFTDTDRLALIDVLDRQAMNRAQVLRAIVEYPVFYDAEFNAGFVEMQYFGYLRRDPDEDGFNFWLNKLNEHGGDFRAAEMVKSFLISGEYRNRFGQ